jgi:hypothetical protein
MAWSLAGVRTGLAAVLTAARPALQMYEKMPASPNCPAGMVSPMPDTAAVMDTFEQAATLSLMVLFVVRKVDEAGAQDELDAEIATSSATSLLSVLDTAVHASWQSVSVRAVTGYGAYTFGAGENPPTYLGCQFVLDVMVA